MTETRTLEDRLNSLSWRLSCVFSMTVLSLAVLLASGCGEGSPSSGTAAGSDTTSTMASAKVVVVTHEEHVRKVDVPATVDGYEMAMLKSRLEGYVGKVHVNIGDEVNGPGKEHSATVLAELDVPEMVADLERYKKMVEKANADLDIRTAERKQAVARKMEQDNLLKLREKEFNRIHGLVRRGALTQEKLDEAQFALDAVNASTALALADIEAADALIKGAKADVEVAEAEANKAKAMCSYQTITAPFDGVITDRSVDPGAFVRPATSDTGSQLFTIQRVDKVRIVMHLPMEDAIFLGAGEYRDEDKEKDNVVLKNLYGKPHQKYSGKITRYAKSFNRNSRMMRVEVDLHNDPDAKTGQRALKPGDYGTATITLATYAGLATVPMSAIGEGDKGHYVIAVDESNVAHYRPIIIKAIYKSDDGKITKAGIASPDGTNFDAQQVVDKNPTIYRNKNGQKISVDQVKEESDQE